MPQIINRACGSFHPEHRHQIGRDGFMLIIGGHHIGHVRPPALHDGGVGQVGHGVIRAAPEHAEQDIGLGVEMDGIILHPRRVQQLDQFGKDLIMALAVFGCHARIELHLEGVLFIVAIGDHARCRHMRNRMGSAMTTISRLPVKIDMTMPGTLSRPRPKVTRPMIRAASTTPMIEPAPPRMETPPSTTMVIASSSQPSAIEGRVEPSRAVSSTAAMPLISPVRQNRINLILSTRTPENRAATSLLPMAKTRRPKLVRCSSTQ